jgi:UDPglucose--hexose-1-phosphate uridylyltransferase
LIQQELNDKRRVVKETEHFIAITPFAPRFSFEVWIIPKRHHCDFAQGVLGIEDDLAGLLKETLLRLKKGLEDPAYNYVIQTAPLRRDTDKNRWRTLEEDYHWHIEVMPRITRVAGFEKGSGFYICSIPPEHTAEYLREVEI